MTKGGPFPLALLLMVCSAHPTLGAQTQAHAPGGTLIGVVRDSATSLPIGYALILVAGKEQRVFASESGRFVLTNMASGLVTLRVQQIGFRAVTVALRVNTSTESGAGGPGIEVWLSRRPVILPEIVVHGDVCTGAEALGTSLAEESILSEAFKNAERILAMEKSYPFRGAFRQTLVPLDRQGRELGTWVDTLVFDSRQLIGYRKGHVLVGERDRGQVADYFTASDLARRDFRKSHCFWYAGPDTSVQGFPGYRIEFAPLGKTKATDWAGALVIDSGSMMLIRSEAHLVNLKAKETTFLDARCVVLYREIVPTLILEGSADCSTSRASATEPGSRKRWSLIDFRFIAKSPVGRTQP